MLSKKKIWLILAASLILIGTIIFIGVMTVLKWDFRKLTTFQYETNTHTFSEGYQNISISSDTAKIVLLPAENAKTSVICYEKQIAKHSVTIENDTLVIKLIDNRKWYHYTGFDFDRPKITVYIPQNTYGTLKIRNDTGSVNVPDDFQFQSVSVSTDTGNITCLASVEESIILKTSTGNIVAKNLSVQQLDVSTSTGNASISGITCSGNISVRLSTGKISMTDVQCETLSTKTKTGNTVLTNVIAQSKLSLKSDTGNVKLQSCDGGEIYITTDTGNISGSLLSEKVFIARSDTGRIRVPNTITGGRCEITTDTGNIKLTLD